MKESDDHARKPKNKKPIALDKLPEKDGETYRGEDVSHIREFQRGVIFQPCGGGRRIIRKTTGGGNY